MASLVEYAWFADQAYNSSSSKENDLDVNDLGDGWTSEEISKGELDPDFSAIVFKKGDEVVISFTGTNNQMIEHPGTNFPAGAGHPNVSQIKDALNLVIKTMEENPNAKITFTGHSLGGGLASIMAIFFDKEAIVFDAAPFEASVTSRQSVCSYYEYLISEKRISDISSSFTTYYEQMISVEEILDPVGISIRELFHNRESNVTNYYLNGEVLETARNLFPAIIGKGKDNVVDIGDQTAGMVSLHSMSLLHAIIRNNAFREAVKNNKYAAEVFTNESLYGYSKTSSEQNFLLKAIEMDSKDKQWLYAMAEDMNKIVVKPNPYGDDFISRGFLAALTEYWYFKGPVCNQISAFTQVQGGVQLDFSFFNKNSDGKGKDALLADIHLSLKSYYKKYNDFTEPLNRDYTVFIKSDGKNLDIQDLENKNTVVLGQESDSTIYEGGAGNDLIIGSASGKNTLWGGDGDDYIYGGKGENYLNGGAGNDVIYADALEHGLLGWDPKFTDTSVLVGGEGSDKLYGGAGNDELWADGTAAYDPETGFELEIANSGKGDIDSLFGGAGNDTLFASHQGETYMDGGEGYNKYYGGYHGGGVGFDHFDITTNKDQQTIYNQSGIGAVYYKGMQLTGGKWSEEEQCYVGNGFYYSLFSPDGGREKTALSISSKNGVRITIYNYVLPDTNARLEIVLKEKEKEPGSGGQKETPEMQEAKESVSPIILDLDKNGIQTSGLGSNSYFDYAGDGLRENTAWVGKGDGILVRDLNGDGIINDGSELFGNNTLLSNGQKANNGYEALAELDENGDGVIDERDSAYHSLKVWVDKNGDGYTDDGELKTLAELGIESIGTGYTDSDYKDQYGNEHKQVGEITFTDGSTSTSTDVWFNVNKTDRVDETQVDLTADIILMPNATGFGDVRDLHQAMALDSNLQGMLKAIINESNATKRSQLLDTFIYRWTGSEGIASGSRGGYIDARQLVALEQLVGKEFLGTWCEGWGAGANLANPHKNAAPILIDEYNKFKRFTEAQILAQTKYNLRGYIVTSGFGSKVDEPIVDWQKLQQKLDGLLSEGKTAEVKEIMSIIDGIGLYSPSYTEQRQEFFYALALNDNRFIPLLSDMVLVTADNATNRHLNLTNGSDHLIKRIGLGDGLTADDIKLIRQGDHLVITDKQGKALITVDKYFWYDYSYENSDKNRYQVTDIMFSSGEKWTKDKIFNDVLNDSQTDGDDLIKGYSTNDTIFAGKGNDTIYGGHGNDTYIFEKGDGQDTIYAQDNNKDTIILKDINRKDISFTRVGNDLIIHYSDTDTIKVVNHFANAAINEVIISNQGEQDVCFKNNKIVLPKNITLDQISVIKEGSNFVLVMGTDNQQMIINIGSMLTDVQLADGNIYQLNNLGSHGDDTLSGKGIFHGGTGNDVINAKTDYSSDTFLFNLGDGQDTINTYDYQSSATDKIIFGKDITIDMISYRKEGNNLIVVVGNQGDQMTLTDYFASSRYQTIRRFEFVDGTVWSNIQQQVFTQYYDDQDNTITGTPWADAIYGGTGNDVITDYAGKNYLDGGDGDDTINGNGTIRGGKGNDIINAKTDYSSDTFLFNLGDGQDTINTYDYQSSATDKIIFGKDVTVDMVSYRREGNNLIVVVGNQGDQMTLTDYFVSSRYQTIKRFEFADGTVWENIIQQGFVQYYGDENNTIVGTAWNDTIYGGVGNDVITDYNGKNYLDGGDGNDTINGKGTIHGGKGNDIININGYQSGGDVVLFNLGDGQDIINCYDSFGSGGDKIIFGEDITADMVSYRREGNNLIIVVGNQGDQMSITDYFAGYKYQSISRFEFADGTVWTNIQQQVFTQYYDDQDNVITGTPWADAIYGGAGNDVITDYTGKNYLDGGDGNDTINGKGTIHGGKGNDIININGYQSGGDVVLFNLGDGQDTINCYDSFGSGGDKIIFGEDITADMIGFYREGSNLVVVVGDQGDQMSITDYFAGYKYQSISRFEFADGTIWNSIGQTAQFKNMTVIQPIAMAASFTNTNSSSLESQTDNLVIAMATFAVTGADTSLLQDKFDDINNTILTVNAI